MRINTHKLREIISEEIDRLTAEAEQEEVDPLVSIIAELEMIATKLMGLGNKEAFDILVTALDGMKELSTSPGNEISMAKAELE